MDFFLPLSVGLLAFLGFVFYHRPMRWYQYLRFLPLASFLLYEKAYGMGGELWQDAFILAGFCTVFILMFFFNQNMMLDHLMLGVNAFFLLGAFGFLFHCTTILEWYNASMGAPFFGCIAVVGLLTTLFTKAGFIGVKHKSNQAIQYASFLLFAATVIALIWSTRSNDPSLLWSIIIPFILLGIVREVLVGQMD